MAFVDYYKVLSIDKTASADEIKKAYRKLARKYHPDVNPNDNEAKQRFQEINEANEVLSDPEKRKKYDQYGDIGNMERSMKKRSNNTVSPNPPEEIHSELGEIHLVAAAPTSTPETLMMGNSRISSNRCLAADAGEAAKVHFVDRTLMPNSA